MGKYNLRHGSTTLAYTICRFEVVTTVRSTQKGDKILEAYPNFSKDKLSYVIVEDIAKEGAFDEVQSHMDLCNFDRC